MLTRRRFGIATALSVAALLLGGAKPMVKTIRRMARKIFGLEVGIGSDMALLIHKEPGPAGSLYPPDTTLAVVALPAVPALPTKLVPFTEPTWGTQVQRISDTGQRHRYSKTQPWNADNSLLHLAYSGRLLNGTTYALVSTAMGNPGNFNWHPTNPVYGYSTQDGDFNLYRHDVTTPTSPTRTSLNNFGRWISLGKGEGGISDNAIVALVDNAGNACTWNVDTNTGSSWFALGGIPDSVTMSHDGTMLVAALSSAIWAWNADGTNGHQVRSGAAHGDTAVSTAGRQVWVQCALTTQMHDLITGAATTLLPIGNATGYGHVSGRGPDGWVFFSVYDTTAAANRAGNDQVWATKLDGSGTVRVYAFANRRGTYYDTQPQAVPSRDGTRVLFATDWGNAGTFDFEASA